MPALAVALALSLTPAEAGAEPVLRWRGPAECPSRSRVLEAVGRYVGRSIDGERVRARGTIERDQSGFVLELRIDGAEGQRETRTLRDADCAVLSDVAALMIAVAIDPEAAAGALEGPEPPSSESSDGGSSSVPEVPGPARPDDPAAAEGTPTEAALPEPPVEGPPEVARPDAPAPARALEPELVEGLEPEPASSPPPLLPRSCRPSKPWAGPDRMVPRCAALAARVVLQWGPLPRAGAGVGGDFSLLWPRLRLAAGGTFFFARPVRIDAADSLGGDVRLGVGRLRACGRLGWGAVELPLCGGAELGALRGIGVGIDHPRTDRLPWFAALVDAGVAWSPWRRLVARIELGAAVPLIEQRFAIDGLGVVYESRPVALRGALAIEWRLP